MKDVKVAASSEKEHQHNPNGCAYAAMLTRSHNQFEKRMLNLEKRIHSVEKNMATKKDLDKVILELQPVRDKASKYDFIVSFTKTPWFWIAFLLFVSCVALAGQRILDILNILPLNP